jgi:TM2 domain-containing membrane protein YozV
VTDGPDAPKDRPTINLKDPVLAAFLAWLIPGLGHFYQGRIAKAILYFVCIMGIYAYGLYLGGGGVFKDKNGDTRNTGYGRAVYYAFRADEWRLPFICQIGVGLPSLPACVQAMRMSNNKPVLFNGFMAPPRMKDATDNARFRGAAENDANADQPTLDDLNRVLNRYFELATFFTMVAGLLNVLAIYDAFSGPVVLTPAKKEEQPNKEETNKKS